jgi:hypothetical protein
MKKEFEILHKYFEELDERIMANIEAQQKSFGTKVVLAVKPWLLLAAIFILAAIIYYNTPYFISNTKIAQVTFYDDMPEDLLTERFDESDIIELIVNEENDNLFSQIASEQNLTEGLSYEDIESFILD